MPAPTSQKLQLPAILFWDVDPTRIDYDSRARYVIGRVVMYGRLADWEAILDYYGPQRVLDEMLQERYLDKRSLNFLAFYFNVPKEQFRCYTLQQSILRTGAKGTSVPENTKSA